MYEYLSNEDNVTVPTKNNERVSSKSSLIWKNVDEQYKRQQNTISPTEAGIIELDRYLNEPKIHRHDKTAIIFEPDTYIQ